MSPEKAYGILSAIAQINGDEKLLEKNPLHDPYFEDMPGEHETAQTVADMAQEQQPGTSGRFGRTRLTFSELGIPVGTELLFREDPQISVQTADEKSGVLYKGKVYKLSAAVATIKQDLGTATPSGAYQGGQYFLFREQPW